MLLENRIEVLQQAISLLEVNSISAIVRLCRFSLTVPETETQRAKGGFSAGGGRVSRLRCKSLIERGLSVSTIMRQSRDR